jgi:uncharacterized protein
MKQLAWRQSVVDYIRANALPPDKFSHQPRLYLLARRLAEDQSFDDDVLYASAWMHDLGVFIGHRPEAPEALASWDMIAYALKTVPPLLDQFGFPKEKIPAVLEVIRTHQPSKKPISFEGTLLRDADILEQLGATAILRTVSKMGRDTRFVYFADALRTLRRNADELPSQLHLDSARRLAEPRVKILCEFLAAAEVENVWDQNNQE